MSTELQIKKCCICNLRFEIPQDTEFAELIHACEKCNDTLGMTVQGYSVTQLKNATKLVKLDGVAQIDENTWQVKSKTNKDKSYFVDNDKCECQGSIFNGQCVHTAAIELYKKSKEEGNE